MVRGSTVVKPGDVFDSGVLVAKACSRCRSVLPLSEFHKGTGTQRGRAECRPCFRAIQKSRRDRNPEKARADVRASYARHREKRVAAAIKYNEINREKINAWHKEHYKRNVAKKCAAASAYWVANRAKINARKRVYCKRRRLEDPQYAIGQKLRGSVGDRIKRSGGKKQNKAWDLIGCSVEWLKAHIENQWKAGMAWDNHGVWRRGGSSKWHIDHIRPCESFDLTDIAQQRECFHWTNLQPLWAIDNLQKGSKLVA